MIIKRIAYYIIMGFFCLTTNLVIGQDQRIADSLAVVYSKDILAGEERLELLRNLSFNETSDNLLALKYAEELIALSEAANNQFYIYSGYLQKGFKLKAIGELEKALTAFFKSVKIAVEIENNSYEGTAHMAIADVYAVMGNKVNSEIYYNKSINLLRKTNDGIFLASAILNAGDNYFNNKKYDLALEYFEESGRIFRDENYLIGTAYNLGNVGMVYAEQGKDELAEKNINEAITILEEMQDYYPISVYLTYMADIYERKNNMKSAFLYAQKSLDLAKKYKLKKEIGDANLKLSELYEKTGDQVRSYKHYKDHIAYRDSVKNIESVQQLADIRTNYEVSQKQTEVNLLSQQKKNQRIVVIATAIALFLIGLLAIGLFRRNKFIQRTKKIIEEEKHRSDSLLLNILPEETAQELKDNGKVEAKQFNAVTVLFTDF
ncbi:MAG: tetratricopeptide repeat protein, partial [Flavobacteriaceae bacterium]|nr:tetratricopeptide repeat protein [Flavobacteriaceae bacterium]